MQDRNTLLQDHATLELKAAQQAQKLIWKYGAAAPARAGRLPGGAFRSRLLNRMSRLAREELRHFEQVVALIERRGGRYTAVSPSRYAAGLHELVRRDEPGALVDVLIVGAIIEARSCERFYCLQEPLRPIDPELADFYASLLRSEARHFEDYLALARSASGNAAGSDFDDESSDDSGSISSSAFKDDDGTFERRVEALLARDAELMGARDTALRFHSGALA